MSTSTNLLQIRRFRAEYLISTDHPNPHLLRSRFDETIEQRLAPVLSELFSPWFSDSDSSVWIIRRLEVDVALNAALERDQITRAFTVQIGKSLAMAMQEGTDTSNVLRFPNRAAYLASLLNDLANGDAWSKWYYESFSGLKLLPVSIALRTAICDDASMGLEALCTLASFELDRVIQNLSSGDARRILDAIAPNARSQGDFRSFNAAWNAWSGSRSPSTWDAWQRTLHIYVTVERSSNDSGLDVRNAALAISHLATALHNGSEVQNARLVNALLTGDAPALYVAAVGANVEFLLPLLTCPADWRREVVRTMLDREGRDEPAGARGGPAGTMHGGIFLLLPIIDDLPLSECVRGWPNIDTAAAVTLVRFLILIKCCGQDRVREAFRDPVVRDLMLIAPQVTPAELREWQAAITDDNLHQFLDSLIQWQLARSSIPGKSQLLVDKLAGDLDYLSLQPVLDIDHSVDFVLSLAAQNVLRSFAYRLPGFGGSNLPYLWRNFLEFHASIEDDVSRRIVRVGRPPLHLILSITGMMRQTYRVAWQDERPLNLFQED